MLQIDDALADDLLGDDVAPWDVESDVSEPETYRDKLDALLFGNPSHGEGGRFASEADRGRYDPAKDSEKLAKLYGTTEKPKIQSDGVIDRGDHKSELLTIRNRGGWLQVQQTQGVGTGDEWLSVIDIRVASALRGLGYAQDLYRRALNVAHSRSLKGVSSDMHTRTHKAGRVWDALAQKHNVSTENDIDYLTKLSDVADEYDKLDALLFGNPSHDDSSGRFASGESGDGKGGGADDKNRYYITVNGEAHIVHDRLFEERGDPYTRYFKGRKGAENAEAKRAELEAKYGGSHWRDKETAKRDKAESTASSGGASTADHPDSAAPTKIAWDGAEGLSVRGELSGRVTSDAAMGGSNLTRLMNIETPSGKVQKVVFRPEAGERWEAASGGPVRLSVHRADGSMALRERIAYDVDRLLGTNMMEDTRVARVGIHDGSSTKYMDGKTLTSSTGKDVAGDAWYRLAVLDVALGNTSRGYKDLLAEGEGLRAIGHGLTFPRDNSEFRFRPDTTRIPATATDATRNTLISRIDALPKRLADSSPAFARLGSQAQAAFYQRLGDLTRALRTNQLRSLVESRNKRKP